MRRATLALVLLCLVLTAELGEAKRKKKGKKKASAPPPAGASKGSPSGSKAGGSASGSGSVGGIGGGGVDDGCPAAHSTSLLDLTNIAAELTQSNPRAGFACMERAVKANPNEPLLWVRHGNAADAIGDTKTARESYKKAGKKDAGGNAGLGELALKEGKFDECIDYLKRAMKYDKTENGVYPYTLAKCLGEKGLYAEALPHALTATKSVVAQRSEWHRYVFHTFAGYVAFRVPDKIHVALEEYIKAKDISPSGQSWFNVGTSYTELTAHVRWKSLRDSSVEQRDYTDESLVAYREALKYDPNHLQAAVSIYHSSNYNAEWSNRTALHEMVENLMEKQLARDESPTITAEMALVAFNEPLLYRINEKMTRDWETELGGPSAGVGIRGKWPRTRINGKLNIGYITTLGKNSIMSYVTDCIYGYHDRSKFTVTVFNLGSPEALTDDVYSDEIVNIGVNDPFAIAREISNRNIHIMFDFSGLKVKEGFQPLQLRPAPLQVAYLGWPCTSGSHDMQYMALDSIVSPPSLHDNDDEELELRYAEKLMYLPSYFVSCHQEKFATADLAETHDERMAVREAMGVPVDKFVFCNFNQMYKQTPELADSWARILNRVPDSVLWLLRHPVAGEKRIRRELVARGIDESRIIFTTPLELERYLEVSGAADLFLDSFLYTAGATAVDMMYAGVPMVTKPGDRIVARMASSIVTAAGCPEMVAKTVQEYEDKAVDYATNPEKLATLRSKLRDAKENSLLFDPARWVRGLEYATEAAWERYESGEEPDHILPEGVSSVDELYSV